MKFSGLQKISLIDFPNRIASVLFTPGCNLRCPFCHNWRIVLDPRPPFLTEEDALRILMERKRFVDSVVITGGEPTIHRELPGFLRKLKNSGFAVKLDTNGLDSKLLKECLPYVDYVAVDVKTSMEKYPKLGTTNAGELIRTIEMLKEGKVEYEFRTTVVPGLVEKEDMQEIFELVRGAKAFSLQQFVPQDTLEKDWTTVKPYSSKEISVYAEDAKKYVECVTLRS